MRDDKTYSNGVKPKGMLINGNKPTVVDRLNFREMARADEEMGRIKANPVQHRDSVLTERMKNWG